MNSKFASASKRSTLRGIVASLMVLVCLVEEGDYPADEAVVLVVVAGDEIVVVVVVAVVVADDGGGTAETRS